MDNYQTGHYLGLRLNKEQDERLKAIADEIILFYPKESYPLSKEEVFSLLAVLGYHIESKFYE